jgi:Spy/CpxP family protein refolding chaperone
MGGSDSKDSAELEQLIADAKASGGSEMANCQTFINRLTAALSPEQPKMSVEENQCKRRNLEQSAPICNHTQQALYSRQHQTCRT